MQLAPKTTDGWMGEHTERSNRPNCKTSPGHDALGCVSESLPSIPARRSVVEDFDNAAA